MTPQERARQEHELSELHKRRPSQEGQSSEAVKYIMCASYSRSAMLAYLNSLLNETNMRLYRKTEKETLAHIQSLYKDYLNFKEQMIRHYKP